jgi:hypothetical protein
VKQSAALVDKVKKSVIAVGPAKAKAGLAANPALKAKIARAVAVVKAANVNKPVLVTAAKTAAAQKNAALLKVAAVARAAKSADPALRAKAQKSLATLNIVAQNRASLKAVAEKQSGGVPGMMIDHQGRIIRGRFVRTTGTSKGRGARTHVLYTQGGTERGTFEKVSGVGAALIGCGCVGVAGPAGHNLPLFGKVRQLKRTADGQGWDFVAADGTRGITTAAGVHAKGPSVQRAAARTLRMKFPQTLSGLLVTRSIQKTPGGGTVIVLTEVDPSMPEGAPAVSASFYKDTFMSMGVRFAAEFNQAAANVYRAMHPEVGMAVIGCPPVVGCPPVSGDEIGELRSASASGPPRPTTRRHGLARRCIAYLRKTQGQSDPAIVKKRSACVQYLRRRRYRLEHRGIATAAANLLPAGGAGGAGAQGAAQRSLGTSPGAPMQAITKFTFAHMPLRAKDPALDRLFREIENFVTTHYSKNHDKTAAQNAATYHAMLPAVIAEHEKQGVLEKYTALSGGKLMEKLDQVMGLRS